MAMSTMTYWLYFIFYPVRCSSCGKQSFNKKTMSNQLVIFPFKDTFSKAWMLVLCSLVWRKKLEYRFLEETSKLGRAITTLPNTNTCNWTRTAELASVGLSLCYPSSSLFEPPHDKTNKMAVRPAKTQISLGIRPVWSVFAVRSMGS